MRCYPPWTCLPTTAAEDSAVRKTPATSAIIDPTNQFCSAGLQTCPVGWLRLTLNQLINSTAPDKGMGVSINIPLRNRAAQATQSLGV